ncbi:MAG: hypothetical protein QM723_08915 [Myxococcaceae bacterium]
MSSTSSEIARSALLSPDLSGAKLIFTSTWELASIEVRPIWSTVNALASVPVMLSLSPPETTPRLLMVIVFWSGKTSGTLLPAVSFTGQALNDSAIGSGR